MTVTVRLGQIVSRNVAVRMIIGRIAAIGVMITVGVVMRIHGRHVVWIVVTTGRRHHRTVSVVVEAVITRTVVTAHAGTDVNDHPRLVVRTVPAEPHRLEVFERGEAV